MTGGTCDSGCAPHHNWASQLAHHTSLNHIINELGLEFILLPARAARATLFSRPRALNAFHLSCPLASVLKGQTQGFEVDVRVQEEFLAFG